VTHAATDSSPPTTTPIFVSPKEAARLLSLSRSRVYELMDAGAIESTRIGTRRVIPVSSLHAFAAQLQKS
jgi:excisionase family DNA binding protein